MNPLFTRFGLVAALVLAGTAVQAQAPTIDGTRDASYPAALAVQTVETSFGDASTASAMSANGSELDNLHARIVGPNLYLFLGGNLESNYNKLEIFFDSKSGGQNQLAGNTYYLASMNGLKFDAGFEADYALTITCGTGALKAYSDYAPIPTGSISTTGIGSSATSFANDLNFGLVVPGAGTGQVAINDSNTGGVGGGTGPANTAAATTVGTGIEYQIPLTALGTTAGGGNIRITAFINGANHDYLSNQVLAGAPAGTGTFAVGNVDFTTVAGLQHVTVINNTATATRGINAVTAPLAAYPNPSTAGFILSYEAARAGQYPLAIRTLSGQLVATRLVTATTAGANTAVWNARDDQGQALAAGVYLAELNGQHQRLILR